MMALKEDNKDMEIHWRQTQHKLQEAVSSLCEVTAHLTSADKNANPVQAIRLKSSSNNNLTQNSALDFLSIFAENNLVSENSSLGPNDFGIDTWNQTLPANFQRKKVHAERPRTLTPPPQQTGKQRFRKRDWKFYAYGKYKTLIPVQKKHEYALSKNVTTASEGEHPIRNGPVKNTNEVVHLDKILVVPPVLCDNQSVCTGERKVSRLDINVNCTDSTDSSNSSKDTLSSSSNGTSEEQGHSSKDVLPIKSDFLKTGDNLFNNKETRPLWKDKCTLESSHNRVNEGTCIIDDDKDQSVNNVGNKSGQIAMDVSSNTTLGVGAGGYTTKSGSHGRLVSNLDLPVQLPSGQQVLKSQTDILQHHNNLLTEDLVTSSSSSMRLVESSSSLANCSENRTEDEGTMTHFPRRDSSSTSDAYYRESSLSPSTPDNPIIVIPPPPALDKHEARLKDVSRTTNGSSRPKSSERKSKKKSKFKDKRDMSPSKTERLREGKISTGTQTQRSVRGYKGVSRPEDHKKPYGHVMLEDLPIVANSQSQLKKITTESSTSSDESGDYKKVNITALRERFVKNRGKSQKKTSHSKNDSKHLQEVNKNTVASSNSRNESDKEKPDCSATNTSSDGNVSLTHHVSINNTPEHETDRCDILENDMYEINEDSVITPVSGRVAESGSYSPVECAQCVAEEHCQYPATDNCLQSNVDCKQWSAMKHSIEGGTYVYCHEYQPSQTAVERVNICQSCRNKCGQGIHIEETEAEVIIPPREQRRLCTLPLMPVIEEDAQKSGESDAESTGTGSNNVNNVNSTIHQVNTFHSVVMDTRNIKPGEDTRRLYGDTVTEDKGPAMSQASHNTSACTSSHVTAPVSPGAQSISSFKSVSSNQSVYSHSSTEGSDGPPPTPTGSNISNNTQPVSLLDKLHKKYYPSQYKDKTRHSNTSSHHNSGKDRKQDNVSQNVIAVTNPTSQTVPNKSVSSPIGIMSPRLRRLSPRQPDKGEEGKPPPSPTSLTEERQHTDILEHSQVQKTSVNEDDTQEIEALEACKWLRAAGFPQYAQMYEDQQFPIDIASVEKDHDFLDPDSIQSLFRRLNTLNKCAGMKIDAPLHKTVDESDEEDQCALSDKWRYQRSSRRWSRKDLDLSELVVGSNQPVKSTSSQDSLLTDNEESTSQLGNSPLPPKKNGARDNVPDRVHIHITDALPEENATRAVNLFDNLDRSRTFKPIQTTPAVNGYYSREGSASPNLRRVQSEKVHSAKSFFKRIESFKTRKSTKKVKYPLSTKLEIGEPIVVNTEDMKERMERLGCKDISPKSMVSDMSEATQELTNDLNTSYTIVSDSDLSPVPSMADNNNTTTDSVFLKSHLISKNNHTSSEDSLNKSSTTTSSSVTSKSSPRGHQGTAVTKEIKGPNSLDEVHPDLNSSELDRVVFSLEHLEPQQSLAGFPTVIPNGFIEVDEGHQLNYRTGSFNLGSHSEDYREHLQAMRNTRAASEEPERDTPHHRRAGNNGLMNTEYRMSVYDNLGPDMDPQQELDKILKDLMENIDGLNQSLGDSESLLELGSFGLHTDVPVSRTSSSASAAVHSRGDLSVAKGSSTTSEPSPKHKLSSGSDTCSVKEPLSLQSSVEAPQLSASDNGSSFIAVHPGHTCKDSKKSRSSSSKEPIETIVAADPSSDVKEGGGSGERRGVDSPHNATAVPASHMEEDMDNIPSTSHSPPPLAMGLDLELHDLEPDDLDPEEEEEDEDEGEVEVRSHSSSGSTCSQHDSDGAEDTAESREGDESSDQKEGRERRDSGVGSSLTRAPSDRRRHRIRWHSFIKSHRPSLNSQNLQISHMSAGQLMVLRKLCLLKVTGLMEKYSPTNRSGWNWAMPKFIKRLKAPDYKDKNVFGVPPLVILHRTGQPLPQCMLYAMRCLRRTAKDAVGIFRKSGVRSRIQKLRDDIEASPDSIDFESLQPYDVADLIKQYFRELPECLLTNKLSETFISVFTHVPSDERLEALQCTVMLLPDENREVLQSLLLFLSDMASHSHHNQMTASNLAVCFAPSLFHMFGQRNAPVGSPKPRGRKSPGVPDQKELLEQKAAHECLTCMITECKKLFLVPEDLLSKCRFSYIEQGDPVPLEELSKKRSAEDDSTNGISAYIESCIQGLLKESRDKFKGWVSVACPSNVDLSYKKVGDGHPLRLWKCAVDVEAPPEEVLNRLLRERHLWDVDLLKWRVVEKLDPQTEVFQYILNSMAPHPSRDFCALRSWRTELPKGACVLVSTSVEHNEGGLLGDIRAVILASRFLIEPCGAGKSRLTHICRIDIRGHTPEWYNKAHGHVCATYVARLRDSFQQTLSKTDGPETKI